MRFFYLFVAENLHIRHAAEVARHCSYYYSVLCRPPLPIPNITGAFRELWPGGWIRCDAHPALRFAFIRSRLNVPLISSHDVLQPLLGIVLLAIHWPTPAYLVSRFIDTVDARTTWPRSSGDTHWSRSYPPDSACLLVFFIALLGRHNSYGGLAGPSASIPHFRSRLAALWSCRRVRCQTHPSTSLAFVIGSFYVPFIRLIEELKPFV